MSIMEGLEWTFDTQTERYEKFRPGYVPALYQDLFQYIPINRASNVIEVGIGGGQATLPVLKTGCKLTAIEYGENFVALCRDKFKEFPHFSAVPAKFEDFESAGQSYDLIYSATAFHWVPEEIGYPKVFQMLKSGGAFARFANHPYRDKGKQQMSEEIDQLYRVYFPNSNPPVEYGEADAKNLAEIAGKYGFVDIAYHLYKRTRRFSAKEYVELLGTYSDHIALEESIRKEFFSEIEKTIEKFGGEITIYDTIDLQLARKP